MTKADQPAPPLEPAPSAEEIVRDPAQRRRARRVRMLSQLLDEAFRVPGTNWRIGWDAIIGLVPGGGDLATGLLSAYIVAEAARLGVPRKTLARMLANLSIDIATGFVPVAGDVVDVAYKANRRNLKLLEKHLARQETEQDAIRGEAGGEREMGGE